MPFGQSAEPLLPVNIQLQTYYNSVKPDGVGDWTIRFQVQLLFPAG